MSSSSCSSPVVYQGAEGLIPWAILRLDITIGFAQADGGRGFAVENDRNVHGNLLIHADINLLEKISTGEDPSECHGMIGSTRRDGLPAPWCTACVAASDVVSVAIRRPVFGLMSNRGKLLLETSRRIR